MIKKIYLKVKNITKVSLGYLSSQRGQLDMFTAILGLAVVTVVIIVALWAVAPNSFNSLWNWFISTMQARFNF